MLDIPTWLWWTTIVVTVGFLLVDVLVIGRRPHTPSTREVARDLAFYVGAAIVFGVVVWVLAGARAGGEFFGGWLTEYSLSVDNLFIFLIIMTKLKVPRAYQQTALMIGIVLALVMRGIFIGIGATAISHFSWVFYLFGIFLIYTAVSLVRDSDHDDTDYDEPRLVRLARRRLPVAQEWNGVRLTVREHGKRLVTPMFIVVLSLGLTDLLFALDSIPAVYGITKEPYLVFTVNVFALMGLRQLYFLLGDLLTRLVYLSYGLSVLLAFIGVKLILEAMHTNELGFVNGGEHIAWAPEIPIWLSLVVIVAILAVTAIASLVKDRADRTSR